MLNCAIPLSKIFLLCFKHNLFETDLSISYVERLWEAAPFSILVVLGEELLCNS